VFVGRERRLIPVALECEDHQISRLLRQLAIFPSAAFSRATPEAWSRKTELYWEDFDSTLGDFPRIVLEGASAMGDSYIGMEHLLLFLARIGVAGIDLPYDCIKQTWLEIMGWS
jgi:hypothetical protein